MALYAPGVTGDTTALRLGVESFLDGGNPQPVIERLGRLDAIAQAAGKWATFGAEIECKFIPNPEATNPPASLNNERLYEEIVEEIQGSHTPAIGKGEMVLPADHPNPLLVNKFEEDSYNAAQKEGSIIELRTAPAGFLEAIERYWQTMQAIGRVAERHGAIGLILAGHVNAAVVQDHSSIASLHNPEAMPFVAAVQHNLLALQPLQIDAGLESGLIVAEAFPFTKDAMTNLYTKRIELRHPLVGAVDPRVDMLATLSALVQAIQNKVPDAARRRLRLCSAVGFTDCPPLIGNALRNRLVYDEQSQRLTLPAELDETAYRADSSNTRGLQELVKRVTGQKDPDIYADNAVVLREIIGALKRNTTDSTLIVDPRNRFASTIKQVFGATKCHPIWPLVRLEAEVISDSPEEHLERRRHLAQSSTVRAILGDALRALVPAKQAVAQRQQLIDEHMYVLSG